MRLKRQNGFAPVETVLILVIVGIVAFTVWYVFTSKSNTDTTYGNAANTQNIYKKSSSASNSNSTTTTAAAVVTTKTDSKSTKYLADTNGKTLYTYGSDTSGVSNCSGSCLTDWPIYDASSAAATLPTNITVITRSDGKKQYAYKGMALYYFTGDSKAGEVNGDGVGGFNLAKP